MVVARFVREGQAASRIRHPHTVDVTDVGVIDGIPCLVMEYLDGESLRAFFRREGAMAVTPLVDLMLPVIAAVDAAHRQGVVHRDLKPPNVFLARGMGGEIHPKVLDFGISKLVDQTQTSDLTADSTFLGSPHYASPEAARGERGVDGRADQYSLGVMLYEGATAVRPFAASADSFMALILAISEGRFPPPRQHRPSCRRHSSASCCAPCRCTRTRDFPPPRSSGAHCCRSPSARPHHLGTGAVPSRRRRPRERRHRSAGSGMLETVAEGGTLERGASVVSAALSSPRQRPWLWAAGGALAVAVAGAAIFALVGRAPRARTRAAPATSVPRPRPIAYP